MMRDEIEPDGFVWQADSGWRDSLRTAGGGATSPEGDHRTSPGRTRLLAFALLIATLELVELRAPTHVIAGGAQTTICATICPGYPDVTTCVVSQNISVVPGSLIDCGARTVQVTSGDLSVSDGQFLLRAQAVLVQQHAITADCPGGVVNHGFRIEATDTITVGTGGSLRANCSAGGGDIELVAESPVSIGGLGIQANGTGPTAPGGTVNIESRGTVTTTAQILATTTAVTGPAGGGSIAIRGTDVTVGEQLTASGVGAPGGFIGIDATGALTVSTGGFSLEATTSAGDGGQIALAAGGTIQTNRPLRARGVGSASRGGGVELEAERVVVNNDISVGGGAGGGVVRLASRGGTVEVGTGAAGPLTIDVTYTSNNPGDAGSFEAMSTGNDVTIASSATIDASGPGTGARGGLVLLTGVAINALAGSLVNADGPAGSGGTIATTARDQTNLAGALHAANGQVEMVYRSTPPSLGAGVVCPCDQVQQGSLPPPCGDGVRRAGVEACDAQDLGDQTCTSLGSPSGILRCTPSCAYDTTGCTGA